MYGQSGELRLARVLLKNLQNQRIRAPGTKEGTKSQVDY